MVPKVEPVVGGEEERTAAELSRGKRGFGDFAALRCLSSLSPLRSLLDAGPGLARFPSLFASRICGFRGILTQGSKCLALQVDGGV